MWTSLWRILFEKKNVTRTRLNMAMNSVPTRLVRSQKNVPTLLFSAVEKIRKPPMKWKMQEDQINLFRAMDIIQFFYEINE